MWTDDGKLERPRWRRFARANIVQLSLVIGNVTAHVVLGWLGAYWFECAWWPWLVAPLCALTGALTLQTCLPDKHVGAFARVLRETLMVYTSTLILATPLIALGVLPLAFDSELLGPVGRRALVLSCYAAAFSLSLWAVVVCRRWVRVTETTIALADLPGALEGYTIAHLSDLHVGSTDSKQVAKSWAALTNRYEPDLIAITGDLVTKGSAFYADVCEVVRELRARDGVYVCLGNHDLYDALAFQKGLESAGVQVLRNRWHSWVRDGARLVVAGVDPGGSLEATLADRPSDGYTVLLAHYPAVFERTQGWGVELVLSGHTHGGQIGMPWFGDKVNVATLTGQRGRGLVENASSRLFVSAGLGTTGVPFRLGVRPELAFLQLRRANSARGPGRAPESIVSTPHD